MIYEIHRSYKIISFAINQLKKTHSHSIVNSVFTMLIIFVYFITTT